jgi:hypothetical protein
MDYSHPTPTSHLSPIPGWCKLVAWHTSLDIQAYDDSGTDRLMIGGKAVENDHPINTVVMLCRITKGQAKRIVMQRWGISIG